MKRWIFNIILIMVLIISSNFGARSLSTNFFMKRQKFVGSDSATKFEAMTSTIISSEKKAAFSL